MPVDVYSSELDFEELNFDELDDDELDALEFQLNEGDPEWEGDEEEEMAEAMDYGEESEGPPGLETPSDSD